MGAAHAKRPKHASGSSAAVGEDESDDDIDVRRDDAPLTRLGLRAAGGGGGGGSDATPPSHARSLARSSVADRMHNTFGLPEGVLIEILARLDVLSICRIASTCKTLRRLSLDDAVWTALFKRRWGAAALAQWLSERATAEEKASTASAAGTGCTVRDLYCLRLVLDLPPVYVPRSEVEMSVFLPPTQPRAGSSGYTLRFLVFGAPRVGKSSLLAKMALDGLPPDGPIVPGAPTRFSSAFDVDGATKLVSCDVVEVPDDAASRATTSDGMMRLLGSYDSSYSSDIFVIVLSVDEIFSLAFAGELCHALQLARSSRLHVPILLVLNKSDVLSSGEDELVEVTYEQAILCAELHRAALIKVSAATGDGLRNLVLSLESGARANETFDRQGRTTMLRAARAVK